MNVAVTYPPKKMKEALILHNNNYMMLLHYKNHGRGHVLRYDFHIV